MSAEESERRWSRDHDRCIDCGTTEKKHAAHGRCTTCEWRFRQGGRRDAAGAEQGTSAEEGERRWSRDYDACTECGRTDSPPNSNGRCVRCVQRGWARNKRAKERAAFGPELLSGSHAGTPVAGDALPATATTREERLAQTMTREGQAAKHKQLWHEQYRACRGCGTTTRSHHSDGLCTDCVRQAGRLHVDAWERDDGERPAREQVIAEIVAEAQRQVAPAPTPLRPTLPHLTPQEQQATPVTERRENVAEPVAIAPTTELAAITSIAPLPVHPMLCDGQPAAVVLPVPAAPILRSRHVVVVREYRLICPNCCARLLTAPEGEASGERDVTCGECQARWRVTAATFADLA